MVPTAWEKNAAIKLALKQEVSNIANVNP